MQINFDYDASTSAAPAGFFAALNEAASVISTEITNVPLTFTINVGWGEVGGTPITGNELAAAAPTGTFVDYNTLVNDFKNQPNQSADDKAFIASAFPATPHGGVQNWFLPTAEAKALGVQDPTTTESDGILGVSSNFAYTFSQNDPGGIAAGTFDLVGILFHEITHAMGRIDDSKGGFFTPFDAGAYNKVTGDAQPLSGPPDRFFSIDGTTPLAGLDSLSDPADLDATNGRLPTDPLFSTISDSFNAFLNPSTLYSWSTLDSRMMDVLGFDTGAPVAQPPQPPDDDHKHHHHHHHDDKMISNNPDPASMQMQAAMAQLLHPGIMNVQDFANLMPAPDMGPGPLGGGSGGSALPTDGILMPPMFDNG